MFTVIFYSIYMEKWCELKKCRKLENASKLARKQYVETGKSHYIRTKDGLLMDRYMKIISEKDAFSSGV